MDILEQIYKNYQTDDKDSINHPSYYTGEKIEAIDFIEDQNLGFSLGNVIKYVSRAGKKDKSTEIEDLKKAAWYLIRRIEELQKEVEVNRVTDYSFQSIIYMSHPYGGLQSNEDSITSIINDLIAQYPDYLFISPVHTF